MGVRCGSACRCDEGKVAAMKALVAFESQRGNAAAVAVAEGLGPERRAFSAADAVGPALADADLIVAGSPVLAFELPAKKIHDSLRSIPRGDAAPTIGKALAKEMR